MKDVIVITKVDTLLGYALAYRFLEEWNRKKLTSHIATEFRLLCQNREGLEELEILGGKIIEIKDEKDENELRPILRQVAFLMYLPSDHEERLKIGEMVFRCAKEEGVQYVSMFSFIGLDHLSDLDEKSNPFPNLKQYYMLEQMMPKYFNKDCYCIFRSTLWHQFFYYYGPMIEDENKIKLSVNKDSKWGSINLMDLVDAVYYLSSSPYKKDTTNSQFGQNCIQELRKKNKTLFQFTPNDKTTTADRLAKAISEGLHAKEDIRYEKVKSEEIIDYLKRIQRDNRFRHRPASESYTFPLGKYLNDNVIHYLIEYWKFADEGYTDIITDDLNESLDRDPETMK
ncbi:uncharacterized protein BX663DRAFT_460735, partial [Cokeromyces recurvatus]|uniref:uncharacterized protein n=1 Tax=Cokeromyces recurvatus TaxID=90255 RepID=UPI00221F7A3D